MYTLGISCATKLISIGIIDELGVHLETSLAQIQAERVIYYIQEAGVKPEELELIAITQGPGSYSGLRAGLASAKTLAQSLNLPLVGVSTLEAMAYNLIDVEGTLAVLLDARANEYNFALFGAVGRKLNRLTEDLVLKWEVLVEKLTDISGKLWLVGNTAALRAVRNWPDNFCFADELHTHPYGINVARIGRRKKEEGETVNPLALMPHYSHVVSFREFRKG